MSEILLSLQLVKIWQCKRISATKPTLAWYNSKNYKRNKKANEQMYETLHFSQLYESLQSCVHFISWILDQNFISLDTCIYSAIKKRSRSYAM